VRQIEPNIQFVTSTTADDAIKTLVKCKVLIFLCASFHKKTRRRLQLKTESVLDDYY
jgi:hypothetical protein